MCVMEIDKEYDFPSWDVTYGKRYETKWRNQNSEQYPVIVEITDDRGKKSYWSRQGFIERFIPLSEWIERERGKRLGEIGI